MVGLQPNCSVQYCYTSKAWHVGSNAYAPIPSCLADDRASFRLSCNRRRPAAASQLYFRTPGLDRNGVSLGWSEDTKYPFDKSFGNGLPFLVRKRDERSKSNEMINGSWRV